MATTSGKPDDRRRPERVASRIRDEIASALRRDLTDPRLENVVLSEVRVTDDLSLARIAIVVLGDDRDGTRAVAAQKVLAKLEGGLRKRIATRLGMRRVPSLRFDVDRTRGEVERLDALLHEVGKDLQRKGE
jgi:ribosome-binding factor A